ncbi:unnamed protein product [Ilex paraguariensis]|uniref:Uncharacterized protein n=1 Tax=Ilex paraguariensis TaxID=185542 RepID=A0ABC8SHK5_9AQUA
MAIATTTAWKPKNLPQKPEDSRSAKEKSIISTVEFVSPELPTISAIADANPITSTQAQEQQITQNLLEVLPPSQNEQDSQHIPHSNLPIVVWTILFTNAFCWKSGQSSSLPPKFYSLALNR